ncbi:hypothetical protein [Arthrobacter sp. CG_A4]|uniref:hypothetical protein n=1 Tax=Arthrobacter sp. CG_A4 TaxID=3071706 RepID=UPI002E0CEFD6|nr:hypothetical protein [Arthrobacter sp. CG_A4]
MNALWITLALLLAGFAGWPVTAIVFRLARTIDDRADAGAAAVGAGDPADDPAADVTVDPSAGPETGPAQDAASGPAAAGSAGASEAAAAGSAGASEAAAAGSAGASEAAAAAAVSSARILRGGAIIGVLERLAVCTAILTGQPVAIAYVVAIKGLGRFAELKETPVAAERFIIGTLTSMLWAAGIAALAKVFFLG